MTLLSWACQIGALEEARMAQGHHRLSGARLTAALYGRDDVHAAVQLQRQVVHRISKGFRPVIPMMRAGGKPVVEKPIAIPPISVLTSDPEEVSVCLPDVTDLIDTDSDESTGDFAEQSTPTSHVQVLQVPTADCLFLFNEASNVAHVAACCQPSLPCQHA